VCSSDLIDAQLLEFKSRHAVSEPWPTRERLLVCVNETDISQTVLRTARRIAEHRRIPWIAVHVQTPRALALPDASRDRVERNLRLAQRLGAETLTLPGTDLVETLVELARTRNATQVVVGRPTARLRLPWQRSVADTLIRRGSPLDVTVVTWRGPPTAPPPPLRLPSWSRPRWQGYLAATGFSLLAAAVAMGLDRYVGLLSLGVVFLLAVLVTAVRLGLGPALYASLLCSALYNFLFTEPHFSLVVHQADDVAALVSFFVAALLAGNVGGRLRQQIEALRRSTRQAQEQAELSRSLAAAVERGEVVRASVEHIARTVGMEAVVM
jgi:two-component system sensor histidine kinase KdpD